MARLFTAEGGYTVEDMLHFGFDHILTGLDHLRAVSPSAYDSARYVINLGFELILKAWHLHEFGSFRDVHPLKNLTDKLQNHKCRLKLSEDDENLLKIVDSWYQLRYPRRKEGPIEISSAAADAVEALLNSLFAQFPKGLVTAYESLTPTSKGGRILMKKKIELLDY